MPRCALPDLAALSPSARWQLRALADDESPPWLFYNQIAARPAPERHGFAIVAAGGRPIGTCSLSIDQSGHVRTHAIAYWVAPAWRRQGFATGAVTELLHVMRATLDIRRVVARVKAENPASVTVLRRNGFTQWGEDRTAVEPTWLFAQDFLALGRRS